MYYLTQYQVITPMYLKVELEYFLAHMAQFWNSLHSIVHVGPTLICFTDMKQE